MTYQGKTKGLGIGKINVEALRAAAIGKKSRESDQEYRARTAARKARRGREESERLMQKSQQQKRTAIGQTVGMAVMPGAGLAGKAAGKIAKRIKRR